MSRTRIICRIRLRVSMTPIRLIAEAQKEGAEIWLRSCSSSSTGRRSSRSRLLYWMTRGIFLISTR